VILPCTPQSDTNRLRPRTTAGRRWGVPRSGAPRLADCNFTVRRDKSFADDLVERPGRVRSRVALLLRATERKPDAALICDSPVIGASRWGSGGARGRGREGPAAAPSGAAGRVTRPTWAAGAGPPKRLGPGPGRGRVTAPPKHLGPYARAGPRPGPGGPGPGGEAP
jgi:hypothetical protein